MNPIIEEICNGRHDMLIGLFTVAALTSCIAFLLLRMLFARTKKKSAFKSIDQDMNPTQKETAEVSAMPPKVPWGDMSKAVRKEMLSVREERASKSENAVAIKCAQERMQLKSLEIDALRLDVELAALNKIQHAIENKKLEIELQTLENQLAALKQPRPKAEASALSDGELEAMQTKKHEIAMPKLENELSALRQPQPPVKARLRRPVKGNMADFENGFDTDYDLGPMPDHMDLNVA